MSFYFVVVTTVNRRMYMHAQLCLYIYMYIPFVIVSLNIICIENLGRGFLFTPSL